MAEKELDAWDLRELIHKNYMLSPIPVSAQGFLDSAEADNGHVIECQEDNCGGVVIIPRDNETYELTSVGCCLRCGRRYQIQDMDSFGENFRDPLGKDSVPEGMKAFDVSFRVPLTFRVVAKNGEEAEMLAGSLDPLTDAQSTPSMWLWEILSVDEVNDGL